MAASCLLLGTGQVWADAYWSIQTGFWDELTTWENRTTGDTPALTLPTASDQVNSVNNSGHVITVRTPDAVADEFNPRTSFFIDPGGILTIGKDLNIRGPITVQAGGTLTVGDDLRFSSNSAKLNVHGTFNVADANAIPERGGTGSEIEVFAGAVFNAEDSGLTTSGGDFTVHGSGSIFKVKNYTLAELAGSTTNEAQELTYVADASGFTTIEVAEFNGNGGILTFATSTQGAERNLIADVAALTPLPNDTWTLMTFDSILRDGNGDDWHNMIVTGAANASLWSFDVTGDDSTAGAVTLTYVPEPGSLALLGLAGLLMFRRRAHA